MNDVSFRVVLGLALMALAVFLRTISRNRLVRRKLRLSILLFAVYAAISLLLPELALTAEMAA
jgi:hypothetical protein